MIYLTAYSEEATLERARGTKPYGYLLKPFSERELHAAHPDGAGAAPGRQRAARERAAAGALVAERTAELAATNEQLEEQTAQRLQAERALP